MIWNMLASRTARPGKSGYAVTAVAIAALAVMPVPGHSAGLSPAGLRAVASTRPVHVHAVRSHPVKAPAMRKWRRPAVSWPAAGSATAAPVWAARSAPAQQRAATVGTARAAKAGPGNAALARPSAGSAQAGSLPVWVGPAAAVAHSSAATKSAQIRGRLRVAVAAHATAVAAGVSGVDRKSTRLNSSHLARSRMPSSA